MSKRLETIIFIIIIAIMVGWGEYIIPIKLQISNIQVFEVIGLDASEDKKVSISLLFEPHKSQDQKEEAKEKVLTVTADSFIGAEKGMKNYEDKVFIGSHIKDIVIGENLAKNDFIRAMEFLGKNNEFRLDSKVYIAKESTANELFNQGIDNNYVLNKRLDALSLSDKSEQEVRSVRVVDIIQALLTDKKVCVIPCVQIVENGDKQLDDYVINTSKNEKKRLELAGYALIKDGKLFSYLGDTESRGYDYIMKIIPEEGIKVAYGEDVIGIAETSSNAKIKYDFSGDTLNKIIIKIDTVNSILETSSGKNIFAKDINTIEELENAYIEDVVKSTITYAQNVNIDFLEIGETMELKHPYKWRKIKDNWDTMFSTIPIEVEVNSNINEQYGVLSTTGKD